MKSPLGTLLNKAPQYIPSRGSSGMMGIGSSNSPLGAMGSASTLFAIVDMLATNTAAVEWHLFRKRTDARRRYGPSDDNRVEITSHLALDIWNKPNPFYTRQEFIEVFQQHHELTGEAWWIVTRSDSGFADIPLELWPVRPDRMSPVPHPTNYLSGYEYKNPNGQSIPLGLDEVVFLRRPNPLDPYRGMGPVQSLLNNIDALKYSAQWNRNFFLNDATPGGIIEVDRRLDDDEFKEMTTRWREQHQGVRNAARVAVIEQGKFQQVAFNMKDMQFAELRQVNREEIREAFHFPKPMLGTVDDVNRANADAAEVVFARWLIRERCERIKQALNNDFLPLFGATSQGLEFDFEDPTPADRAADLAEQQASVKMAIDLIKAGFDPADSLEYCGLPELEYDKPAPPPQFGQDPNEDPEDDQAPVENRSNGNGHGKIGALR